MAFEARQERRSVHVGQQHRHAWITRRGEVQLPGASQRRCRRAGGKYAVFAAPVVPGRQAGAGRTRKGPLTSSWSGDVLDDEVTSAPAKTSSALTMKIAMNLLEKLSRTAERIHHPACFMCRSRQVRQGVRPGITIGPMRTRSSSITTGRWVTRWRRAWSNTARGWLAAADHEQEVGVGSVERRDAEVGERVPDGDCQGTATGVVVHGDPESRSPDVEAAGVDHRSAGEQRPEHIVDVRLELGNLGAHEPAQLVDVTGSVEEAAGTSEVQVGRR